ncbi:MAG: 3'-5' exonuclease [Phycisphaeraceae bacterium]
MNFLLADTFTSSLARLTGEEQKAVKTTAFDLQTNPASTSLSFHKLDRARDKNFWSVRASLDIRIIVHRTDESLMLCYVDHHDKAYDWAERRKIQRHPRTGVALLVEIRERVKEITIPTYIESPEPKRPVAKPRLFDHLTADDLLAYGVPEEWIADVQEATEDTIFAITDRLPTEAAEALLELATGGTPTPAVSQLAETQHAGFEHPDAQRRFRVMSSSEELQQALSYPWEKWTVFLHPSQRELVEKAYAGPARVAGSAGTGKTIVALHRAVYVARTAPDARVLLTTFSRTLARALRIKLDRLAGSEPTVLDRITVRAIDEVGLDLYEQHHGKPTLATLAMIQTLLREAKKQSPDLKFSLRFLETEWSDVVDAWQLTSWEAYRDVARLGRKTRLGEKQRQQVWEVLSSLRSELEGRGLTTMPSVFAAAEEAIRGRETLPFTHAVIDEAQDISVPQLRLMAALAADRGDALFFAGDLGQRIFQTPFSWKSLGVDVRGRSQTLRINYRTSQQIREHADRLLPPEVTDVDGNKDTRKGTISVFSGPAPEIEILETEAAEIETVSCWLTRQIESGLPAEEIGVFVRSSAQLPRAHAAIKAASVDACDLDGQKDLEPGHIAVSTMHLAKGLEFRAVVVMACDDEVIPLQERIEAVADEADLEEVYNTERHLLYVACTRARDHLLITGTDPASDFLADLTVTSS